MNLLLFDSTDTREGDRIVIGGRRAKHVHSTLRVEVGDSIAVGEVNGAMGTGRIVTMERSLLELEVVLDKQPPAPLPVSLVVALPRPKSLKKVLHVAASAGVKALHLIHSYKVDKSYWQSPVLRPETIREHLILGLEQGMDTMLPTVTSHRYFKPFIEDVYPELAEGKRRIIGHPKASQPCPLGINEPTILVIGPEGGFIDYEVEKFADADTQAVSLGERILRVEYAVAATLGKLFN
jgi:16S rRNA (uracil1498-N3)-methyltransferase